MPKKNDNEEEVQQPAARPFTVAWVEEADTEDVEERTRRALLLGRMDLMPENVVLNGQTGKFIATREETEAVANDESNVPVAYYGGQHAGSVGLVNSSMDSRLTSAGAAGTAGGGTTGGGTATAGRGGSTAGTGTAGTAGGTATA